LHGQRHPLFPGHCLLIPKTHYETLTDLPDDLTGPFSRNAKLLARAVEQAMESDERAAPAHPHRAVPQ
jgi:histidine triad (HIT) family protein